MCCSPNSGGSQLTLASQWESRKVMTSPLAAEAPSRRVLMSPSLFLVLRIRTFGIRFMYSSSGTFRCSAESAERQIISMTRCQYSRFSRHLSSIPGETVEWRQQESSFFISLVGSWGGRWSLAWCSLATHGRSQRSPHLSRQLMAEPGLSVWGLGTSYRVAPVASPQRLSLFFLLQYVLNTVYMKITLLLLIT